jgi:hypothetical protein
VDAARALVVGDRITAEQYNPLIRPVREVFGEQEWLTKPDGA